MAVRSLFSTFSNFDGPDGWVVCPYRCPGSLGLFRGSLAPVSWSTEPQAVGCSGPSADLRRASVEPFEARKQVASGKNSFLAIERPNFEAGYLGQFLDLDELIGDTVGTKYKVTFPSPKTVV